MWNAWQAATGEISTTYIAPGLNVQVGEIVRQEGRAFVRGTLKNALPQPQRGILLSIGLYDAAGVLVEIPSAKNKELGTGCGPDMGMGDPRAVRSCCQSGNLTC